VIVIDGLTGDDGGPRYRLVTVHSIGTLSLAVPEQPEE